MPSVAHTLAIARRELGATLASPVTVVLIVLFLVVQGFGFWAVLEVLGDPRRPAPYGAVLRTFFGGTFLHWTFISFVTCALTMRTIADERRTGTWEVLCAAPVGDGAIVVGKWLGALGAYAGLWVPTILYPLVLRAIAPPGAGPDPGPVATAYLGVLLVGAGFLAVGVAASAATSSQVAAAAVAFVLLLALLLTGALPETVPAWFSPGALGTTIAETIDLRRHMDGFARGIVDTADVAFHVGLTVSALVAATMLAGAGRRRRSQVPSAVLAVGLVVIAAILANVEAARHRRLFDATRARVYTLEPRTRQILADVERPVRVLVVAGSAPEFAALYDEILVLLRRFHDEQPLLTVEIVDPAADPGRIGALATQYELSEAEVGQGGAVVFLGEVRHRGVALADMAALSPVGDRGGGRDRDGDAGDPGATLSDFRGEAAFAAALLEVTDDARPELCFSVSHGELPPGPRPTGQDLSAIVHALGKDGVRIAELADLGAGVPAHCAALAIVGPRRPIPALEAKALASYLGGGGRLLVAVDPEQSPNGAALAPTGLELVLAQVGVVLGAGVVVDPERQIRVALSWITDDGYSDHPVVAGFDGRRVTYWFAPRWIEVQPVPGATAAALVSSTPLGYAETNLATLGGGGPRRDDRDVAGPVAVAAAAETRGGGRVVVFGSARSFTSEVVDRGLGSSDLLFQSAVAWLMDRTKLVGVGAKTPEQFRVALGAGQSRRLFFLCVAGWPALFGLFGVWSLWRRRSR